jgi:hypothetical protein
VYHGAEAAAGIHRRPPPAAQAPAHLPSRLSPLAGFKSPVGLGYWTRMVFRAGHRAVSPLPGPPALPDDLVAHDNLAAHARGKVARGGQLTKVVWNGSSGRGGRRANWNGRATSRADRTNRRARKARQVEMGGCGVRGSNTASVPVGPGRRGADQGSKVRLWQV